MTYQARLLGPVIGISILFSLVPLADAGAQSPTSGVFLAVPQAFPDIDARAIVVRERGKEVVLLRHDDATPEVLDAALAVLRRVRDDRLPSGQGQMIPITGFVRGSSLPPERRTPLEDALDALARRPVTSVGRYGLGQWVHVDIR